MVETVYSAELPVNEHLLVQKNRICGHGNGPRMAVVTGIHGDELEGQYVAFELARRLNDDLDLLHGTVDIYPAINPLGINTIQRGVPTFDIDLNRTFPGDPAGNLTQVATAAVVDDILGADVCVDIHASNIFLREMPQVRINEITADSLLPLAPLLGVDLVWVHASATVLQNTLAYSLNERGTRCLVVETGVGMRIPESYGKRLVDGLLRLLGSLGGWDGSVPDALRPTVARDQRVEFLNASEPGIFLPRVRHGSTLKRGQLVGVVCDPLTGTVREDVISEQGGLLFTLREYPVVYPGSLMARVLGGAR